MFRPKKTIPKVAAAGLMLTGLGCGDDGGGTGGMNGTGGTGGTMMDGGGDGSMDGGTRSGVSEASIRASCTRQMICAGEADGGVTFPYAGGIDECVDNVDLGYDQGFPPACISAIEALLDCSANDCSFFTDNQMDDTCTAEAMAKDSACS